ncbi:MAG TPA: NYN domain-containing protein [Tepidisphaeraceae bacterium]|nr:NYN domain-containing protein [Tepidisphaeraceae bacterium]
MAAGQPLPTSPGLTRVITYIDGFNLYFGLRAGKLKRFYWLDVNSLASNLLLPNQTLVAAKYFTSRISGPAKGNTSPAAQALEESRLRQALYLDALATTPLQIIEGHFLNKGGHCRACGATWASFEEKMTDVNIATELLTDAFTNTFDTALIISADSDLVPPIRALRHHFPAKRVLVIFPPNRASKELRAAAHANFTIGHGTLTKSQLPDEVPKQGGFILRRPAFWR